MELSKRREGAEELGAFTIMIEYKVGTEYDGRMGLRISAIFVILIGSLLGYIILLLLARFPQSRVATHALFVVRYFGSGVIVATAFIHLLAPVISALYSLPRRGDRHRAVPMARGHMPHFGLRHVPRRAAHKAFRPDP